MLWVAWRQHRIELFVALMLLAAVGAPLLVSGLAMHADYQTDGVAACVADPDRGGCAVIVERFIANHIQFGNRLNWAAFLPALVGVFVGAPLLAREFEQGTWRLAFTQSVSRTRWLATKLMVAGGFAAFAALALGLLVTWWREPLNAIGGPLRSAAFVISPPSLVSATVFGFALGVFAGAVLRRTVAAMGVALLVFVAVRIPLEDAGRPNYFTPLTRLSEPDTGWRPSTGWVVGNGWMDAAGRRLTTADEHDWGRQAEASGSSVNKYMLEHGLRPFAEYHPNSALPAMQVIEAAIFLGMAAALLAAAIWLVKRRTA